MMVNSGLEYLIIVIDNLDRCSPDRIIETMEAIKLFLSVQGTTFIIAIDEEVVSYPVQRKYPKFDDASLDISKGAIISQEEIRSILEQEGDISVTYFKPGHNNEDFELQLDITFREMYSWHIANEGLPESLHHWKNILLKRKYKIQEMKQ